MSFEPISKKKKKEKEKERDMGLWEISVHVGLIQIYGAYGPWNWMALEMLRGNSGNVGITLEQVAVSGGSIRWKNPPLSAAPLKQKHPPNLCFLLRTQLQLRTHILRIPASFMAESSSRSLLYSSSILSASFPVRFWFTLRLVSEKTIERKLKSGFVNNGNLDWLAFHYLLLPL